MRSDVTAMIALVLAAAGCGTNERILTDNVVDPANLAGITRFRSCCGHSYGGSGESNRSMKHYLIPFAALMGSDRSVPVFSPFDGEIVSMNPEQHVLWCLGATFQGYQIRIVPRARPDTHVVIFHVNATRGPGAVASGEQIGYADLRNCDGYSSFDVTIQSGSDLYSYFDWLEDGTFAPWQARGLPSREAAIVSKEARDADPCDFSIQTQCDADTIVFP
jgi:hypothetical protein